MHLLTDTSKWTRDETVRDMADFIELTRR